MIRSALEQMSRTAAILAVALLCAQTLVIVHDHQVSDSELCAVCSTPVEHADTPELVETATVRPKIVSTPALAPLAPATPTPTTHLARAPPIT